MTNAGRVSGISEVSQGHGLDIKPYGLVRREPPPERATGGTRTRMRASTSSTTRRPASTNLTINTDFAQTEVDQRQVNLTRFDLFFPERRDFFLDGATFFDFASNSVDRRTGPALLQPPHRPQRGRHAADARLRDQVQRPDRLAGRGLPARSHG